jgi:uncharacterized protein (DUF1501 family)
MASRRTFLSSSIGIAVLGAAVPAALARAAEAQALPVPGAATDPRNVLVVVQMNGGNDGLNTVIPYSDDRYHRVRPTIGLEEKAVLRIDDRIGLNPVMAPLLELYKEGHVALVQGVGYPNPNRSHFEATQIWETASPDRPLSTGWLGRYLDRVVPKEGTPPTLFTGVTLGDTVPAAMISQHVDVPAIGGINAFNYSGGKDTASKASAGVLFDGARPGQSPYLQLLEDTSRTAYHGGDILKAKIAGYQRLATYPTDPFSTQLALAAQIIGSDVGTRIIFVSIGSFDTHAGQRSQQDRLLGYLSAGLSAFYKDLTAHGDADRVMVMTFSEFGRRVNQNASAGTDHGTAMPLFVIGGKVKGGTYGDHPSLSDLDANGDLKFQTDFRDIYATVVADFLGRNPTEVLGGEYGRLAFV